MNWLSPNAFARRTMANPTMLQGTTATPAATAVAAPLGVTLGHPQRPVAPRRVTMPGPEATRGPVQAQVATRAMPTARTMPTQPIAAGGMSVRGCLTEGIAKCKDLHEEGKLDTHEAAQCITGMYKGCQKGTAGSGFGLTGNPVTLHRALLRRLGAPVGTRKYCQNNDDCPKGSICVVTGSGTAECTSARSSRPWFGLLSNPVANAARAVGRLMVGAPRLRARRASRPLGTPPQDRTGCVEYCTKAPGWTCCWNKTVGAYCCPRGHVIRL